MSQYLLRFVGDDDYVSLPVPADLSDANPFEFTIDFSCVNVNDGRIVAFANSTNNGFLGLGCATDGSGRVRLFGNGTNVTGTAVAFDGNRHTIRLTYNSRDIAVYVDGSSTPDFTARTDGSNALVQYQTGRFTIGAVVRNTPASVVASTPIDLYGFTFSQPTTSDERNYDPSASNGTGTTLFDTVGGNNGTLVNFTVPDCWVLIPSAGVTVTGATASYSYSAVSASVSLAGEILVTGQTPNYSYTAIGATIDITGEIVVTGATPSYSYSSINGVVTLIPAAAIVVTGQTTSYSYAPISGVVELTPEIQITGATASYSYTAQGASVTLQGTIDITGATVSYTYAPVNAFVSLNALEPTVNFSGLIKQAAFAGILRNSQFSGTIKQSQFSGTRKAAQFSGVRK